MLCVLCGWVCGCLGFGVSCVDLSCLSCLFALRIGGVGLCWLDIGSGVSVLAGVFRRLLFCGLV